MKADRLRRFIDLHAWLGMVSGLALFVAFFAGAINVFHHELHHWQESHHGHEQAAGPADPDHFLQQLITRFPASADRMYFLPDEDPGAMWFQPGEDGAAGEWRTAHASNFAEDGSFTQQPGSELADFVNELHYELGIPGNGGLINIGMTLMGFVAVLYGVALFSGLIIHWPKIRKELFALKHQGNLRRYWKNLHNLIGIISFPFHLIMSVTGAAMGLFTVMAIVLGLLVFGPQLQGVIQKETDVWPPVQSQGETLAMAPMADYLAAANNELPGMDVGWVEIRGYGDAAGWMDVAGSQPGFLGHHVHVVLDNTMKPLRISAPGERTFNFAAISPVYSLHFGDYGGVWVKLLYFAMGLLGSLLFVSGNILWCERRSDRVGPSRSSAFLLRLTLGLCFGVVSGIAFSFLVSKLLPYTPWAALVASAERQVFWWVLVVLVLWSLRASPLRFSGLWLRIMPFLYLAIPLAQVVVEGSHAWQEPDALLVNLVVVAVAACLWGVRAQFRKRLRLAEPHPLWVGKVTRDHPKHLTEIELENQGAG